MRYTEFRDKIRKALQRNPEGMTWKELKSGLNLPYERPCPDWVGKLENEIALTRQKGTGNALVWMLER